MVQPWEGLTWTLSGDLRLHCIRSVFLECLGKVLRSGGRRNGGMLLLLGGSIEISKERGSRTDDFLGGEGLYDIRSYIYLYSTTRFVFTRSVRETRGWLGQSLASNLK